MSERQPQYIGPSNQLPPPKEENYGIDVTREFTALKNLREDLLAAGLFGHEVKEKVILFINL